MKAEICEIPHNCAATFNSTPATILAISVSRNKDCDLIHRKGRTTRQTFENNESYYKTMDELVHHLLSNSFKSCDEGSKEAIAKSNQKASYNAQHRP